MPKLRFNITMSLDGYVAGPDQSSGRLFENLDGGPSGYECVELSSPPRPTTATYGRTER